MHPMITKTFVLSLLMAIPTVEKVDEAWSAAGRSDTPRKASLTYFSLGPEADKNAQWYLGDYYGFADPYAKHTIAAALTTPDKVRDAIVAYSDAGCDELIIFPCTSDPAALQRLADVLSSAR